MAAFVLPKPPTLDLQSVDVLLNVLTRLKECGGQVETDSIWSRVEEKSPERKQDSETPYYGEHILESVCKTLRILEYSANERAKHLKHDLVDKRASLLPQWFTPLLHLPDEILEEIIKLAYQDDSPDLGGPLCSETACTLSRVCRRLAEVASRGPELWQRVSNNQDASEVKVYLERSKSKPLSVTVTARRDVNRYVFESDFQPCLEAFLDLVSKHRNRWHAFTVNAIDVSDSDSVDLDLDDPIDNSGMEVLFEELAKRPFDIPALRCLSLNYSPNMEMIPLRDEPDWDARHFYTKWNVANLEKLVTRNFVPEDITVVSLQWLSITVDDEHDCECSRWWKLLEFLSKFPSLRHIELHRRRDDETNPSAAGFLNLNDIRLPNLEFLGISGSQVFLELMVYFLRQSTLTKLSVVAHLKKYEELDKNWLRHVMCGDEHGHRNLKELEIAVKADDGTYREVDISPVLSEDICLHRLTLEGLGFKLLLPRAQSYDSYIGRTFQKLRLIACDAYDEDSMKTLLSQLLMKFGAYSTIPDFEQLEIRGCPNLLAYKGLLEASLPEEQLVWKEV